MLSNSQIFATSVALWTFVGLKDLKNLAVETAKSWAIQFTEDQVYYADFDATEIQPSCQETLAENSKLKAEVAALKTKMAIWTFPDLSDPVIASVFTVVLVYSSAQTTADVGLGRKLSKLVKELVRAVSGTVLFTSILENLQNGEISRVFFGFFDDVIFRARKNAGPTLTKAGCIVLGMIGVGFVSLQLFIAVNVNKVRRGPDGRLGLGINSPAGKVAKALLNETLTSRLWRFIKAISGIGTLMSIFDSIFGDEGDSFVTPPRLHPNSRLNQLRQEQMLETSLIFSAPSSPTTQGRVRSASYPLKNSNSAQILGQGLTFNSPITQRYAQFAKDGVSRPRVASKLASRRARMRKMTLEEVKSETEPDSVASGVQEVETVADE